ncbi:MAG: ATP-binding protein, partial [Prevotella sp.]|nr:ATP-binding protein [Prevotella sp.]
IGYGKSPMEYLQENKGFLTYKGDVPQVSTACILLFGKRPQNFFPRARVRFVKYYGTEEKVGREMNVIKDVTFEGRILDQIQKTIDYLETQVKEHSYLGEDGLFKTDREYPKFVIQEMTVNSVCHRDYSIKGTEIQIKMFDDRLVFETPGKLPGIVRIDNIRHTHFSRNPKIAEYLKAYDYVKEFGEGVDRMCRELSAIGTKEPQYHLVAFIMKASVWANVLEGQEKARERQEDIPSDQVEGDITQKLPRNYPEATQKQDIDITPVQKRIIDFLLLHPYAGRKEISSNLGSLSEDGVKYNLKILQQKGVIKRIGPAKGGFWKVLSDETSD